MIADFQAIYGLRIDPDNDEWAGLSGAQFWPMAHRLYAYKGAIRMRLEHDAQKRQEQKQEQVKQWESKKAEIAWGMTAGKKLTN